MRVLLLTQLFDPEPNFLKGLGFARELGRRGHTVEVLTGFPNYPGGRIYPGYRQRVWTRETVDGISVIRSPLYPSHDRSALRRICSYLSFAVSAGLVGQLTTRRPDVIHVYQGPATLFLPALLLKWRHRVPYLLDVQDIWPESVLASGMYQMRRGRNLLQRWCDASYRQAARIVVLSEGYQQAVCARGIPWDKTEVVYNWCDESVDWHQPTNPQRKAALGFGPGFQIVYAGSFGPVQALDSVLEAAELLMRSKADINFTFVGTGVDERRLTQRVLDRQMKNVRFIPRQPVHQVPQYLAAADALLIHLKDDPLCRIGIPSKTQSCLAAGRPILMAVAGCAANLVERAHAGLTCAPQNALALAETARRMAAMSQEALTLMGENGRNYYQANLSFAVGVPRMEAALRGAAEQA